MAGYIDTNDAIGALRGEVPISRIWQLINSLHHLHWRNDTHDPIKAYVMACFSELAYLHLAEFELAEADRYKVFVPSAVGAALLHAGVRIDVRSVVQTIADVPIDVIETEKFVYIVGRVGPFTVVAVRGTVMTSWRDWLIDFDAAKNPARNGFYHRGFDDEATRALPLLESAVATDANPLYFTGHSLGAAVASILTQRWEDQSNVRIPYIFASPRFGTRAAARRQPRHLYVRPKDIVPHVPPRFYGFSDEGAERHYLPEHTQAANGLMSLGYSLAGRFSYHFMEGHRALLGDLIGERFPEQVYLDILKKLNPRPD